MTTGKRFDGKLVFLRDLEDNDLLRTHSWLHRQDISERIGVRIPFTLEDQAHWFARIPSVADKFVFAVCRIADGRHVGNVSIDNIDKRHCHGRISIFIADEGERGNGLGSDALQTLSRFAFKNLNLHKIWCKTNADEPELKSFYIRNGFELEGRLQQHELSQEGVWRDKWVFGRVNKHTEVGWGLNDAG